jgi:orotate phosphoribosyltransferase
MGTLELSLVAGFALAGTILFAIVSWSLLSQGYRNIAKLRKSLKEHPSKEPEVEREEVAEAEVQEGKKPFNNP